MAYYLDTSAAVKLVAAESGSTALRGWIEDAAAHVVSSDLLRTELLRTVRRGAPYALARAREVLESVALVAVATPGFERAALLEPEELRSLDALHLAAALDLGDDLDGIVTYDERLAGAARANGVPVVSPG